MSWIDDLADDIWDNEPVSYFELVDRIRSAFNRWNNPPEEDEDPDQSDE